uniref:Ig-like domain-containing protein n=1 Tax=Limnohabitans sp. Rim8 TaxID=1100718 RepID=UPI0025F26FF5
MAADKFIAVHNGQSLTSLQRGQSHTFKARAGDHYRILKALDDRQLEGNVVAKRLGADLILQFQDGTQITLEGYFVACQGGACDITLPAADSAGVLLSSEVGSSLSQPDGFQLLYTFGQTSGILEVASRTAPAKESMPESLFSAWVPPRLKQILDTFRTAITPESDNPHLLGWLGAGAGLLFLGQSGGGSGSAPSEVDKTAPALPLVPMVISDDVEKIRGDLTPLQAVTNDATPQFSGSGAEAGAQVTLFDGALVLGKTGVGANGAWSFTPSTPLAEGLHRIRYTLSDAAGNTSPSSTEVAFTVDTRTPGTLGVGLDPSDSGDVSQGVVLRVLLDDQAAAGDSIETRLMRDDVEVQVMLQTLSSNDIQQGHVLQRVDAAAVATNGRFSTSTRLFDAAGNESQVLKKLDTFTVLDGLVHDDYMANAFVFVDGNNSGQFEEGEFSVRTDAGGRFKLTFDPNGAPVLAMGGVDTASGSANGAVVYRAYTSNVDTQNAGLDIVLSPLSTLIAALADQATPQGQGQGQFVSQTQLIEAAAVANQVLGLNSQSPAGLLSFDPVQAAENPISTAGDRVLLSVNRQLGLVFAATGALIDGASNSDSISTGAASGVGISSMAQMMVTRSQTGASLSLSGADDMKELMQTSIQSANAKGLTQELRASSEADMQTLGGVVANYNAAVSATTTASAQSQEALATLRAAANILMPSLNQVGYEASLSRGGDISLTLQSQAIAAGVGADSAAYVEQQISAGNLPANISGFETSPASGTVGRVIRLSIQMPSLGLSDALDQFKLSALPLGVDLLKTNPLTGQSSPLSANAQGEYEVAAQDVGYLAIRSAVPISATQVGLFGLNTVEGNTQTYLGQLTVEIRQAVLSTQADIVLARDSAGPIQGAIAPGGLTDDPSPRLTGRLNQALVQGERLVIYDGSARLGLATVTDRDWSFTPAALAQGSHSMVARVEDASGAVVSASSPRNFSVDTLAPAAPVLYPSDGLTFGGMASAGETVSLQLSDGRTLASATVEANGQWRLALPQALPDGTVVSVVLTDGNGLQSTAVSQTVQVGKPTAVASVNWPSAGANASAVEASTGLTNNATPTLSGRLSAELKTGQTLHVFDGDVDLGPAQVNGLGWQFTPPNALAQGEHSLTVRAMAGAQLGPIAAPFKLTVDTLAPTQTGSFNPDQVSLTQQGSPVITGQLSSGLQAGETLAVYDTFNGQRILLGNAKVEGRAWTFETPYSLADGSHSFSVSVRDAASNAGPLSQPYNLEVDTVAPTAVPGRIQAFSTDDKLGDGSAAASNDRYPRFSVGDLPAGVTQLVLVVNGQDWPSDYNAQTGLLSPSATHPLLDGLHTIAVKFADAASNTGSASATMSVRIDATPPSTPASAPSGYTDNAGNQTSASNTAESTDDTTPGLFVGTGLTDTPKLYVNGTLVAASYNSSTGTLTPNAALIDGNYSFTYSLTDAAGNESAKSAALAFTVDTTAPATPAAAPTGYTDDAGSLTSASASNTAATTDDTTPGLFVGIGLIDSPKLYVNGTLVAASYNSTIGTLTPNAALTDGNYSFEYTLTDAAGNESAKSAALTVAVDTTAPATPSAAPTGYTDDAGSLTSASASNTAATTDDTTPGLFVGIGLIDTPKLYVNGTLVAATYNSSNGTLTPNAALTDGNYSFEYTLTDAAGNESAKSAALTAAVDTTAPATP